MLFDHIPEFLAEPKQNTALGFAHSSGCDTEIGRDVRRSVSFDSRPPKGLPGLCLEFGLDQLECPAVKRAQIVDGVVGKIRFCEPLKCHVGIGPALSFGSSMAGTIIIEDFVSGDATEPTAETVVGTIASKSVETRHNSPEYLLPDIFGVRAMYTLVAAPSLYERTIKMDQPAPCLGFVIPGAFEERGRGQMVRRIHNPTREEPRNETGVTLLRSTQ